MSEPLNPAQPNLPSRPVLLITDTEKSSKAWTGMHATECRALFEGEILKRFQEAGAPSVGYVVQDTGDGFVVVFPSMNAALRCAVAFQNGLAGDKAVNVTLRSGETLTAKVRMAIHAAIPDVLPEFNPSVERYYYKDQETVFAWRVMSLGHGGQILLTPSARAAIHNVLEFSEPIKTWPRRRIADFEPHDVYQYLWDGVVGREPGTIDLPDWCLRDQRRYVPRPEWEEQIIAGFEAIAPSGQAYHLITLVAEGGMGKSRLATECAIKLAGFFTGDMFMAEINDTARDPTPRDRVLLSTLAREINAMKGAEVVDSTIEKITAFLKTYGDKRVLLCIHNYECVCDNDTAEVKAVLDALLENRNVYLIVTSRVKFGGGGLLFDLSEGLTDAEARDLFIGKAREARDAGWTPNARENDAIEAIIELTEHIPLALELVAARAGMAGGLPHVAEALRKTPMLVCATRAGDKRQDSLLRSLDWSYHLLPPDAKAAWSRLSLFGGSFTADTARGAFGWPPLDDPLTTLLDASIVRKEGDENGERYTMHGFVRQYAEWRFNGLPKEMRIVGLKFSCLPKAKQSEARAQFIAYWGAWADEHRFRAEQRDERGNVTGYEYHNERLPHWDAEAHNVIAAQLIAAQAQERATSSRLYNLLDTFLVFRRGRWTEAEQFLQKNQLIDSVAGDRADEAASLHGLANVYNKQGRWDEAIKTYKDSMEIKKAIGNQQGEAASLHGLANVYVSQGRWDEAIKTYEDSIKVTKAIGDRQGEAVSLHGLGMAHGNQKQWKLAADYFERSCIIANSLGNWHGSAGSQYMLAQVQMMQDDLAGALKTLQAATQTAKRTEDAALQEKIRQKLAQVLQAGDAG